VSIPYKTPQKVRGEVLLAR